MDSSQVFQQNQFFKHLLRIFHVQFVWENLPEGLASYAVRLLARQQLLHRIHH